MTSDSIRQPIFDVETGDLFEVLELGDPSQSTASLLFPRHRHGRQAIRLIRRIAETVGWDQRSAGPPFDRDSASHQ